MNERTVREFTASTDVWPIVDAWADESHYDLKDFGESSRLYRKRGFTRWMLEISQEGSKIRLEAWVQRQWWQVLAMFAGASSVPSEMGIESGGGREQVLIRDRARPEVNDLLGRLGQPPIE